MSKQMKKPQPIIPDPHGSDRHDWAQWLAHYGAEAFFDAFMATAQDAAGTCRFCHQRIYLDIAEGGGICDWRTADGDYGCEKSPETCEDGTGGHHPIRLEDEKES
jgi:hypothetical protein